MNVLIVAHGHPSLHKGGGEVAAYSMFQMLRAAGHHAVFLGWSGHAESPTRGALQQIGEDDYLLYTRSEYFHFSSQSVNLRNALEAILATAEFDAVHLHHYIHVGIEAATLVKQLSPQSRVILTLHEYLAICANNGQLFTPAGAVCSGYAPERCATCFPERNAATFFMREIAVKSAFSFVDHFLSPSEFLRQQYIRWGIAPARISAIENPLPLTPLVAARELAPPRRGAPWKIGFFGQINFYKGLDILLDGIAQAVDGGAELHIGVHGSMSAVTGEEYIEGLKQRIAELGARAVFHGPYQQARVQELMSQYHFVAMGSRWYENSPVVIQEAIAAGRPLIVPGHGGMLEKTQGIGLAFTPGDSNSLAQRLQALDKRQYTALKAEVVRQRDAVAVNKQRYFEQTVACYADLPQSETGRASQ